MNKCINIIFLQLICSTANLRLIQEVVNNPQPKLTQAKDVRWLSHERAVSNLRKCLPYVRNYKFEREAHERQDTQALGLAYFVRSKTLWLLCQSCVTSYSTTCSTLQNIPVSNFKNYLPFVITVKPLILASH